MASTTEGADPAVLEATGEPAGEVAGEEAPPPDLDELLPKGKRRRRRLADRGLLTPAAERGGAESLLVRTVAIAGVIGIAVAVAAVMGGFGAAGWSVGLVASVLSLALVAGLWRGRVI